MSKTSIKEQFLRSKCQNLSRREYSRELMDPSLGLMTGNWEPML